MVPVGVDAFTFNASEGLKTKIHCKCDGKECVLDVVTVCDVCYTGLHYRW